MVEVMATGMGANSKKPRESGRAFLTPSQAGVVFPAPRVPTLIQKPALPVRCFFCSAISWVSATYLRFSISAQNHPAPLLDASATRRFISTADGPDTPLHRTPISLKSFDDGHTETIAQVLRWHQRSSILAFIVRNIFPNITPLMLRTLQVKISETSPRR